jgi:hypothetical protein
MHQKTFGPQIEALVSIHWLSTSDQQKLTPIPTGYFYTQGLEQLSDFDDRLSVLKLFDRSHTMGHLT